MGAVNSNFRIGWGSRIFLAHLQLTKSG
jgi:hypothetical protein